MKRIAIVYHDADYDGILSNEVCRFHLKRQFPDSYITSYGWDYGRPTPRPDAALEGIDGMEFYDQIYIVDLAVDELMRNPALQPKIVWIDHHASSLKKYAKYLPIYDAENPDIVVSVKEQYVFKGHRIDGVAACRLCWQWFIAPDWTKLPGICDYEDRVVSEPELIRLAGEYDVWDHRDVNGRALQFGLKVQTPEQFKKLVSAQFSNTGSEYDRNLAWSLLAKVISEGGPIKLYADMQAEKYATANAYSVNLHGLYFCALNCSEKGSFFVAPAARPEHDALMSWRRAADGSIAVSMYHIDGKENRNLLAIATHFNGGGHRGACGFSLTIEDFYKLGLNTDAKVKYP